MEENQVDIYQMWENFFWDNVKRNGWRKIERKDWDDNQLGDWICFQVKRVAMLCTERGRVDTRIITHIYKISKEKNPRGESALKTRKRRASTPSNTVQCLLVSVAFSTLMRPLKINRSNPILLRLFDLMKYLYL